MRRVPTARNDPGRGPHYRDRSCRERTRSSRLQIRPSFRSLPWPRPETKLIGGQGPSRAYIEDGQRLLASVAGCWRYFGHSAGTNHRHPNRSLGPIAPRAQTDTARHSGHRQQIRSYSLGAARDRGDLQGRTGHLTEGDIKAALQARRDEMQGQT